MSESVDAPAGRTPAREARILHIITRLDRGGSTTETLVTAAGLPGVFRPSLIYGRTHDWPALPAGIREKVEMIEVPELVRDPAPLKDLRALLKLHRLIRRGKFDLVHTHTSKAGILGRVAARLAGVPRIVHTPHGHIFTGYYGRALTRLFILLERWAATFTDRIIALTDQEIRDHLERGIGRPEQFVSIPSGIEVDALDRAPGQVEAVRAALGLAPDARLIGSVGRLEPVKGHRFLLDALRDLAPRFPDLHLALVGDGELLPELRAQAGRSGLADRVLFLGWRNDVPRLLPAFHLFVLPSENEGMGRALVEAMAAGLPIVASRAGGVPEVLGEGEAGLLVEAANAPALAQAIETLLRDRALGARLGEAARKRAHRYSVATMLREIEALYRGLLAHDGAVP